MRICCEIGTESVKLLVGTLESKEAVPLASPLYESPCLVSRGKFKFSIFKSKPFSVVGNIFS